MEVSYSLSADDFLDFQMYSSGKSDEGRRRRNVHRWIMVAIAAGFGLLQLKSGSLPGAITFFCFTVLCFFFHSKYSAWRYRRHYRRSIAENYQGRIGIESTMRLQEDGAVSITDEGEGLLKYAAVKEMVELDATYLLILGSDVTLLFPKRQVSDEFVRELAQRAEVEIRDECGMKWA
ncbi:MAG: hypothetical protein ACI8XO_000085 [Verrucomicrobiales bacterium]|mgnify:CR=1 FL=1|jgi:hypothetical protein